MRLIRFVCPGVEAGIFQAAYGLLSEGAPSVTDRSDLRDALEWFRRHLKAPDSLVRTKSKGAHRREPVAICWFRDDANECIRHAWRIVEILRRNDIAVDLVRTSSPGFVTYADEHQVAAIPFADR